MDTGAFWHTVFGKPFAVEDKSISRINSSIYRRILNPAAIVGIRHMAKC